MRLTKLFFITLICYTCSAGFIYHQVYKATDLYITPRHANYGWHDPGIFLYEFHFKRKSIKRPYGFRSFWTSYVMDSVYELFYAKVNFPKRLLEQITPIYKEKPGTKRIMIVIESADTIYIDDKFNVIKKEGYFLASKRLKKFLESYMPKELKENWVH